MVGVLILEGDKWFIQTEEKKYNLSIYHHFLASLLSSYLPPNTPVHFDLSLGEEKGAFLIEKKYF
jgi:hypothetical protein